MKTSAAPATEPGDRIDEANILDWLRGAVAVLLEIPEAAVRGKERLRDQGIDSLKAAELLRKLSAFLGRPLHATLPWRFPTIEEMARHLASGANDAAPVDAATRPQTAADEPIAVVGIACRFPGGAISSARFWQMLWEGADAIREVPAERWDVDAYFDADRTAPGKMNTRWGGFLNDVSGFDAGFFGVSPREVVEMDPQQRLMLELAWEAFEDAGVDPAKLRGSPTGVFVGAMWSDYARSVEGGTELISQHTATGQDLSIIPARVSYTFGLEGPSLTVNTACSSSLVAIQLACQSLRAGDSSAALAGGVNLILAPHSTVAMSKFGGMSPEGHCKAFDARADGYVRSEGGGFVLLKRLSRALLDGDRIYCVIRGGAINNDGYSNGLTAPNPLAQEAVLRAACANAGVPAESVSYVETHGPGTMLGDPIEAGALGAVLGAARPADQPLRIGSVKTNIGHAEAAAGVAGLIKVALSIDHEAIPANLHFERPNPYIDFERQRLEVSARRGSWPERKAPRVAGVSSFGFGGTNCHLVVEEAPRSRTRLLALGAESEEALWERAGLVSRLLGDAMPRQKLDGLCRAAGEDAARPYRLTVTGASPGELEAALRQAIASTSPMAPVAPTRQRIVFVFPGHGGQWVRMGLRLMVSEPVFRRAIEACDQAFRPLVGWSVIEALTAPEERSRLGQADVLQALVFSFQIGLAALWRSWGITPDGVIGHSLGEVAAAHVAGILSLEDAARVVAARSRLVLERAAGRGTVAAIGLPAAEVDAAIAAYAGKLVVAGHNSPEATLISGDLDAIDEVITALEGRGVVARRVAIGFASHSHHMDPLLDPLREALQGLAPRRAALSMWSTVDGAELDGRACGADYWARNLRSPVRFRQAVVAMLTAGPTIFVELAGHPVLRVPVQQSVAAQGRADPVLASCFRHEDERSSLLEAAGRLFVAGIPVDFSEIYRGAAPAPLPWASPRPEAASARGSQAKGALHLLALSGQTQAALRDRARALAEELAARPSLELADVAYTASARRGHFQRRLAVIAESGPEAAAELRSFLESGSDRRVIAGPEEGAERAPRVAFVFTGQGSQYAGMGRALYETQPVFRDAIDRCEAALDGLLPVPLRAVLYPEDGAASLVDDTRCTQPALFALEYALAALWRSWGVEPAAILGHSVGEIAAACFAGVFSLEDGLKLVATRGRLMSELPPGGRMVSLRASEKRVAPLVLGRADQVSIAAVNGAEQTVISGAGEAVAAIVEELRREGIEAHELTVSHAFHSPLMSPMIEAFAEVARSVAYAPPQFHLMSNITGSLADNRISSAAYWVEHVRAPVRFADGLAALAACGIDALIEIGPQPVLLGMGRRASSMDSISLWLPSLRKNSQGLDVPLRSLGSLYARGAAIAWEAVHRPHAPRLVDLPAYPFQRKRHWLQAKQPRTEGGGARTWTSDGAHPLSGQALRLPGETIHHVLRVSERRMPYLSDHIVHGRVVVPGAFHLAVLLAIAADRLGAAGVTLRDVAFLRPLILDGEAELYVTLAPQGPGYHFEIATSHGDGTGEPAFRVHVAGHLEPSVGPASSPPEEPGARLGARRPGASLFQRLADVDIAWGPRWQWLRELTASDRAVIARIAPAQAGESAEAPLHPALIDNGFGAAIFLVLERLEGGGATYLPYALDTLRFHAPLSGAAWCHAALRGPPDQQAEVVLSDLTLFDDEGRVLCEIGGFALKRAPRGAFLQMGEAAPKAPLYAVAWRGADISRSALPQGSAWLVLSESPEEGAAIGERLRSEGATVAQATWGHEDVRAILESAQVNEPLSGVLCSWRPAVLAAEEPVAEEAQRIALRALTLVQELARVKTPPRLVWVTERAVAVHEGEAPAPAQATVWGLGRVVMQEHPELRLALIDVEAGALEAVASSLAAEGGAQLAYRRGSWHKPRLSPAPAVPSSGARIDPAGAVLITGGLGALGLHVARSLVRDHGVRRLVLMGRRGPESEPQRAALEALAAQGAAVTVAQVDVADAAALEAWFAREAPASLRGVIHAAGVLDDGVLLQQDSARFAGVLAPKVRGAWNLHRATRDRALDFFVLFSSGASLTGQPGQGNYACANAFLDALAAFRKANGLPALSLNWGPWSGGGMAEGLSQPSRRRLGLMGAAIAPEQGVLWLVEAIGRPEAQFAVLTIDRKALGELGLALPPILEELAPRAAKPGAVAEGPTLAERLSSIEPGARLEVLHGIVRSTAAKILGLDAAELPLDRPWKELGLDSLMAVEMRNGVASLARVSLPATVVFDYPTVESLSRYLLREVLSTEAAPARAAAPSAKASMNEPIAIVGMACRFPGGVVDPEGFWDLLSRGGDAITEILPERWDADAFYDPNVDAPGKIATRWGGFIDGIDRFDAAFFGVTPAEARSMDPHQRLLLETCVEALERAGEVRDKLAESDTGVYVGIWSSDFEARTLSTALTAPRDPYGTTGRMRSATAGRLSYWLGLRGPSMAVDTACSSALVAIHLACQGLRAGECSLALAGGVHLMLSPENVIWISQAGVMSPTGRCRSFDMSADGYVLSEGCGVIVLKRLRDAEAAGDPILAVIRGSAINHDGRSNGLTTPSGPAQRALLRRALEQAESPPDAVEYVETHGTGTRLGDAIEARALGEELGQGRAPGRALRIGSVKSNIGHTQGAAGIASVIKVLLAFDREELPPTIHVATLNPDVPWDERSLSVVTSRTPWPRRPSSPRLAGVSAFGMTGMNAHLILEEPPPRAPRPSPRATTFLVPLSARTDASLQDLVQRVRAWIECHPDAQLADIAYTASARRSLMAARLAVIASSRASLLASLDAFLQGDRCDRTFTEHSLPGSGHVGALAPREDAELLALARRYARGEAVDLRALHPDGGEVVDLPTTPFERQRFWIDMASRSPGASAVAPVGRTQLTEALVALDAEGRLARLAAFLREQVGEMLHLPSSAVPAQAAWVDLGMDSMQGIELLNRIRAALGVELSSASIFRHQTLPELAAFLATLSASSKPEASVASGPAIVAARTADELEFAPTADELEFEEGLV